MRPTGTVYKNSAGNIHGEIRISLTQSEKSIYKKRRLVGAFLASLSFTFLIFFYGPASTLDLEILHSRLTQSAQQIVESQNNATIVLASDLKENTQELIKPVVNEFSLNIPTINAVSKIIYDVDPFTKEEYLAALQKGIAHASTSSLPGQSGRVYLFAHSTNSPLNFTQFNAVFYQLRLLQNGDKIVITLNGEEFVYKVTDKHIVSANDTHWLTESGEKEELVLQTCDPPGTTLRRLLIIAEPII